MYEFITSRENESFGLTKTQMLSIVSFLFNSDINWYDGNCREARCTLAGRGSTAAYEAHVNLFNKINHANPMLSELAAVPELRVKILDLPARAANLYNFAITQPKLLKSASRPDSNDLVMRMVNFALTRADVLYDAFNSGYDITVVPETSSVSHICNTYVKIPSEQRKPFSSIFIHDTNKVWGIMGNWLGIEYNPNSDAVNIMDGTIAWLPRDRWPGCDGFPKTGEGCHHTFNNYVEYLVHNNHQINQEWGSLSGDSKAKRKIIFDNLWSGSTQSEWITKLKNEPEAFTNAMIKLLSDKII